LVTIPNIYTIKGAGITCLPDWKKNHTMMIIDLPQGVYVGKSVTVKL
jgi:chondroitin AC lyase